MEALDKPLRRVHGKRIVPLSAEELRALAEPYAGCLIDVGTGDGRFVYRQAAEHPDTLCLGLDAVAEAMAETSARAARKPARGGLANALFLVEAAEQLPGGLAGLADRITVNYPWGSLLRALTDPQPEVVARIAALGRPGSRISILLNVSVYEDAPHAERLQLVPVDAERAARELAPAFAGCGIELTGIEPIAGQAPHRTSWGQRLVLGSARRTLALEGRVGAAVIPPA